MRTLFVINPTAGRGAARRAWNQIEQTVARLPGCDAVIPGSYAETLQAAAGAVRDRYDRVVALGGDGTLDAVAGELAGTETWMGVIAGGTGNDFAKTLGLPLNPRAALSVALGPDTRLLDLGRGPGGSPFLNVAGVGFDAKVAAVARQYPKGLGGTLPYLMGAVATLSRFTPVPLEVVVDGQFWSGPATLVAIANGSQYGGGMKIAPGARRDDGVFDVYAADGMGAMELLGLLPKVYTGAHVKHPKVHRLQGARVTVRPSGPVHAHVDGDVIEPGDLTFRVQAAALRVAVTENTSQP